MKYPQLPAKLGPSCEPKSEKIKSKGVKTQIGHFHKKGTFGNKVNNEINVFGECIHLNPTTTFLLFTRVGNSEQDDPSHKTSCQTLYVTDDAADTCTEVLLEVLGAIVAS